MPKRAKDAFRGKQTLGSASSRAPKRPKPQADGGGGGGRSSRSFWGFMAAAGAMATLWATALLMMRSKKERKAASDRLTLSALMRRPIKYSEHAKCRMGCRFISEFEVLETLKKGRINERKSEQQLFPCPKYVVDAQVGVRHKKNVQVVCSGCPDATNVVTVIDRDRDWPCHCPV